MLKKISSFAVATLMLVTAFSGITVNSAHAVASSDASLNIGASTIKGVALTSYTPTSCIDCMNSPTTLQTTFTLTPSQAVSAATTAFVATDAGATVKVLKMANVMLPFTDTSFTNGFAWDLTGDIYHNEIIMIRVTAADGFTKNYYGYKISAASSDATFSLVKFKGVTVSSLGTPNANIASAVAGAVTLTADQAASTSLPNVYTQTVFSSYPTQRKKFASGANPTSNDFNSAANYSNGALSDGDLVVIKNTAGDGTTSLYYKFIVTIGASSSGNSSSSDSIAAAAAAAKAAAEKVAAAKVTLVDNLKAGKPITANDLNSAEINVASAAAAERVNAKIQALPAAQRSDLAAIKVIVQKENFIEKVSSSTTQVTVNSLDLIRVGLIAADYKHKTEVLRTLIAKDPSTLTSMEKVEAAVKEATAAIQARKDRLAATIAKIYNNK